MSEITLNLEDLCNSQPNMTFEQKIELYALCLGDCEQKNGKVIVENGKIIGYRPYKKMSKIKIELTIDGKRCKNE